MLYIEEALSYWSYCNAVNCISMSQKQTQWIRNVEDNENWETKYKTPTGLKKVGQSSPSSSNEW